MNNDEILAKFGISKKLVYGLMFQTILVIFATIISLWGVFSLLNQTGINLNYITNLISLLVCISLLVYSFYGFNAKRNQEAFFTSSIILFIILTIFGLITTTLNLKNPSNIFIMITLISTIFFLSEYLKSYKSANYAMLIVIISSVISVILNIMAGMPWFVAVKYLIIPVSMGLTYFERTKRGIYDFKIWMVKKLLNTNLELIFQFYSFF